MTALLLTLFAFSPLLLLYWEDMPFGVFLIALFVTGTTATLFAIHLHNDFEREHPCLESHVEHRYQPGTTTFIWTGNVMIPILNPGYYYDTSVCDKRKGL